MTTITPRQAKYAETLALALGYESARAMWHEYGYVERTPWGDKSVTPSKAGASDVIARLKARVGGTE